MLTKPCILSSGLKVAMADSSAADPRALPPGPPRDWKSQWRGRSKMLKTSHFFNILEQIRHETLYFVEWIEFRTKKNPLPPTLKYHLGPSPGLKVAMAGSQQNVKKLMTF